MQELIKRLAVEAGLHINGHTSDERIAACARFAQAVARECAEMLIREAEDWVDHAQRDDIDDDDKAMSFAREDSLKEMAEAIRARFGIATPPGDG